MLKFSLDSKRKKFFLDFWSIKETKDFKKKVNDINTFLSIYVGLSDFQKKIIGYAIRIYLEKDVLYFDEKKLKIEIKEKAKLSKKNNKKISLKNPESEIKFKKLKKDLEFLDNIHLINFLKKNILSMDSDYFFYELTEETLFFLTKVYFLTEQENFISFEKDFFDNQETKTQEKSIENSKERFFLNNIDRSFIIFNLYGNGYWYKKNNKKNSNISSEKIDLINISNEKIILPAIINNVNLILLKKRKNQNSENLDVVCQNIANKIKESNQTQLYLNLSFYNKVKLILKNYFYNSFLLLNHLYEEYAPLQKINKNKIAYHHQNYLFVKGKKIITKEKIKKHFQQLINIGLLIEIDQENYFFLPEVVNILSENKISKANNKENDILMIDNTLTFSCYKSQINLEVIYFFYCCCQLKIDEYIIQAKLDSKLVSSSWFSNLSHNEIKRILKHYSKSFYTQDVENQIAIYFKSNADFFYNKKQSVFITPSKEVFNTTLHEIGSNDEFKKKVFFIESLNLVLFENDEVQQKVKNLLEKKNIFLFEK